MTAVEPVRPELVEGPNFLPAPREEEQGFDKLSPNGVFRKDVLA